MVHFSFFLTRRIITKCLCSPLRPRSSSCSHIISFFQACGQRQLESKRTTTCLGDRQMKGLICLDDASLIHECRKNFHTEDSGIWTCELCDLPILQEVLLQLLLVWVDDAFPTLVYKGNYSNLFYLLNKFSQSEYVFLRKLPSGDSAVRPDLRTRNLLSISGTQRS